MNIYNKYLLNTFKFVDYTSFFLPTIPKIKHFHKYIQIDYLRADLIRCIEFKSSNSNLQDNP